MITSPSDSTKLATAVACGITVIAAAVVIGGWMTFHFDAALLCYASATVFMVYALTYRFVLWVQRPPTAAFYQRAAIAIRQPKYWFPLALACGRYLGANLFIWKRGTGRWAAHWPIMVGCLMAASIAFPLVFGWLGFITPQDSFDHYVMVAFGMEVMRFPFDSFFAFMLFHGLVWASIPVIAGTLIALYRRLHDRGDAAVQSFSHDLLPLLLLLSIAVTGLSLAASYTWLQGAAYDFLAVVHASAVIGTLLYLPFGKLLHIPQRSLKVAHMVYDLAAKDVGMVTCKRCGSEFATKWQIEDLKKVQAQLGYKYDLLPGSATEHWQDICPKCRRALLVTAQSRRWCGARSEEIQSMDAPQPVLVES